MRRKFSQRLERLEDRRLLAVITEVIGGDLMVSGSAEGAVEIVSVGDGAFDVIDDGELVASLEGVNDDIRVNLDAAGKSDDSLTIRLEDADVDSVIVDLGDGDNELLLASGTTRGSVQFRGGAGDDTLEVAEDFAIGGSLSAFLGDGENTLDMAGSVDRSLNVTSGDAGDLIRLDAASQIGGRVSLRLGDGDNTSILEGAIESSLYYRGGAGSDLVDILATAQVEGRTTLWLGGGDNNVAVEGTLGSHLNAYAKGGDDALAIGDSGSIAGNARLRLGAGDNVIENSGFIDGKFKADKPVELPSPVMPEAPIQATLDFNALLNRIFEFKGSGRFLPPLDA